MQGEGEINALSEICQCLVEQVAMFMEVTALLLFTTGGAEKEFRRIEWRKFSIDETCDYHHIEPDAARLIERGDVDSVAVLLTHVVPDLRNGMLQPVDIECQMPGLICFAFQFEEAEEFIE